MITRRASVTALVAVAVAGLASGCLSSNSGGGSSGGGTASGPGKGTVEIMYGFGGDQEVAFQKDLNTFAQANGFTVKFTKAASWGTDLNLTADQQGFIVAYPDGAAGKEKPDFILHRDPYKKAGIFVTGPNFGCGSTREGAVLFRPAPPRMRSAARATIDNADPHSPHRRVLAGSRAFG